MKMNEDEDEWRCLEADLMYEFTGHWYGIYNCNSRQIVKKN